MNNFKIYAPLNLNGRRFDTDTQIMLTEGISYGSLDSLKNFVSAWLKYGRNYPIIAIDADTKEELFRIYYKKSKGLSAYVADIQESFKPFYNTAAKTAEHVAETTEAFDPYSRNVSRRYTVSWIESECKYATCLNKAYFPTEEMAEQFAALLKGAGYRGVEIVNGEELEEEEEMPF